MTIAMAGKSCCPFLGGCTVVIHSLFAIVSKRVNTKLSEMDVLDSPFSVHFPVF